MKPSLAHRRSRVLAYRPALDCGLQAFAFARAASAGVASTNQLSVRQSRDPVQSRQVLGPNIRQSEASGFLRQFVELDCL